MRFAYRPFPVHAVPSLGGERARYRPVVPLHVEGPSGSCDLDVLVDSGADDVVLPEGLAEALGIDLRRASFRSAASVGAARVSYQYASVELAVSDGNETFRWGALVGFLSGAMSFPVVGHAGFLQFFDAELLGAERVLVLRPNRSFKGTCQGMSR